MAIPSCKAKKNRHNPGRAGLCFVVCLSPRKCTLPAGELQSFLLVAVGLLILNLIKSQNTSFWLWIGLVFGLGFLNKYSIVFFYAAFGLVLLISRHRHLMWSGWFLAVIGLALAVISPNLLWQYSHNIPVMMHMEELRESQLVHVNPLDFLEDQLLMNAHALLFWLGVVVVLLFHRNEKAHRLFGLMFVFIVLLLLAGSGKSYYTLGIYPILFAFGASLLKNTYRDSGWLWPVDWWC